MKRYLPLFLCLALCCALFACGNPAPAPTTAEPTATPFETTTEAPAETQDSTEIQELTTVAVPILTDPNFDVAALFERVKGYWSTRGIDDHPGFVGFDYQDGKPCVIWGMWDGEHTGYIEVIGGQSTGEDTAALAIFFPAQPEEAMYPGPERTEMAHLDLTGLESGGTIEVKRESPWGGEWRAYTYGGKTMREAQSNNTH